MVRLSRAAIMRFSPVVFSCLNIHLDWQPQNDLWPDNQDRDGDQMRNEMWKDAVEHLSHRSSRVACDHKPVQSDGGVIMPDLSAVTIFE